MCVFVHTTSQQSTAAGLDHLKPSNAQAHLWNVLPHDVIRSVLEKLPFKDALTCRSLSSSWASAVQASVPIELVIPANRRNLGAKLRRLQQAASQASSTVSDLQSYTFKLREPISVNDCSSLLRSLSKQVNTALYLSCE